MKTPVVITFTLLFLSLTLSACSWFTPYQQTLEQGNLSDPEQLNQLHLGMSAEQVIYLLGSPLIKTPDNPQEWDYIYQKRQGTKLLERTFMRLEFASNSKGQLTLQKISR